MLAAGIRCSRAEGSDFGRALGRLVVNGARRAAADTTTSGTARSRPIHAERMSGPDRAGNSAGCASARRTLRASSLR